METHKLVELGVKGTPPLQYILVAFSLGIPAEFPDFTQKTRFCSKPVYPTPFTPKFPVCPTGLDFCLFTRLPNITRDLGW